MRKELLCVFFITFFCMLLLSLQFLLDAWRTPPGALYLGTIHYAPDYFNYMSWIVQGEKHVLSSTLLYSVEHVPYNLSRWEFVLAGFIFSKFGIGPIFIYHISVFLFRIFFFVSAYLVIRVFYLQSAFKRVLAFFFFATSTAWPIVEFSNTGIYFGYHYFWYNTGNFFARFGPTPNHLLGSSLLALTFYFFIRSFYKKTVFLVGLTIVGFLLSSISPIHWILVAVSALLTSLLYLKKESSFIFIPSVLLLLSGILPALYLHNLYLTIPYTLVTTWEAAQRLQMGIPSFFFANGLVSVFALSGVIPFLKQFKRERVFAVVFLGICLVLFISTLHQKIGIMNVRFWPQAIYIFIGLIAVSGVVSFSSLFGRRKEFVIVILVLFYTLTVTSSYIGQMKDEIKPKLGDSMVYLPYDVYTAYAFVKRTVPENSVFLVPWPLNQSFPALTGRKALYGDPISNMTVDAYQKSQFAIRFIDGVLSIGEARSSLRGYGVSYVLAYKGLGFEKYPFLKKIFETSSIGIYEVQL